MDKIIEQLDQDLARAEYTERTRRSYRARAEDLARHFGKPIAEISREELRTFVDAMMTRESRTSAREECVFALLFLYRRTLGQPDMVSFIKIPKRHGTPLEIALRRSRRETLSIARPQRPDRLPISEHRARRLRRRARCVASRLDTPRQIRIDRLSSGHAARAAPGFVPPCFVGGLSRAARLACTDETLTTASFEVNARKLPSCLSSFEVNARRLPGASDRSK